jgi:hypothetical protein
MREELTIQFGHRIRSQYDDTGKKPHEFILEALDEAPQELLDESRHAIKRNNSEFVKREKFFRSKGVPFTWKNVGTFLSLALALAAAKLRLTLMQHSAEDREQLIASVLDLMPIGMVDSKPGPKPEPEPEKAPAPAKKKATKKKS